MAEVEVNTDWIAHEPVEMVTGLGVGHHGVDTGRRTQPMWADDGSGGLVEQPPIPPDPDTTLADLLDTTTTPRTHTNMLWRMTTDNNYGALFDPFALETYHAHGTVTAAGIAVVDNDGLNWAQERERELRDQVYAEVPGALSPRITWETTPGDFFGSHSNRRLTISTEIFQDVYQHFEPNQMSEPGQFGPLDTLIRVPLGVPKTGDTYTQTTGYESASTSMDYQFTLREVLTSGTALVGGAVTPSLLRYDVPDSLFDIEASVVTRVGAKTRALLTWAAPDVLALWNQQRQMQYQYVMPGDEFGFLAAVHSTFQPPRYRIRYWVEEPDTVPIRRTFPRDDGRAGGAPRTWPPSKAGQSSNRIELGGGYL